MTSSPRPASPEHWHRAEVEGVYRGEFEKDACGIGLLADIRGRQSHELVRDSLEALARMAHRGAEGGDGHTGDGAGILMGIPHRLFREVARSNWWRRPDPDKYAVGVLFLPRLDSESARDETRHLIESLCWDEGLAPLAWREVPTRPEACGEVARESRPWIVHLVLDCSDLDASVPDLDAHLYLVRKQLERLSRQEGLGLYVASLSRRTMVYKGMLMAHQLAEFYPDLASPVTQSHVALVHQRFSTNTTPSWERAQPMRMLAHNGEINAVRGNENWMRARENRLRAPVFGGRDELLLPVIEPSGSDSARLDNAVELLCRAGRAPEHAMAMVMPQAWENDDGIEPDLRAFYRYHAAIMEPWDGPAAVVYTDGVRVGASLDRNGLRPARWAVDERGWLLVASEAGVLDWEPSTIVRQGRLGPGQMLALDTSCAELRLNGQIKAALAGARPWKAWLDRHQLDFTDLPEAPPETVVPLSQPDLRSQQQAFGYTREELNVVLGPMATLAKEPIGSMGDDTPLAVLSDRVRPLFDYFKQVFAQVTNPPIDPLREKVVMSLRTAIGPRRNAIDERPDHAALMVLPSPVLSAAPFRRIAGYDRGAFRTYVISTLYDPALGAAGLEAALARIQREAERAAATGHGLVVLSDASHGTSLAPIPSLLATSAVHHHLIRRSLRSHVSLIVDSGEPREVMHIALLLGFGAAAVHPRLALATVADLAESGRLDGVVDAETAEKGFLNAIEKGLAKVMSKIGIASMDSYRGAQLFEALGLGRDLMDQYFPGTVSRLGGIGLDEIADDIATLHQSAWGGQTRVAPSLDEGGMYQWRRRGEKHRYDPSSITWLQHACRKNSEPLYRRYADHVNADPSNLHTLRGLFDIASGREPIDLDEVESAAEIVKRFKTGAMSFGSISKEAHETLAIAMNRLGGKSNSGEGGEDPARFALDENGDSRRSAIKQVASGRFGVTIHYLVNADEIQIKMAQGAKPGEGGHLPGHKVDSNIAKLRCSTPGVGLISPPPHHDIYSIEDLAQLISDLKAANENARINVKLVSVSGVGTIASGVAKAGADTILISGSSGGTGAAPLSSIRHAGLPWELGLAEAQQALVLNGLRGGVRLETDGQLRTGRDVVMAALLGAEEFGFATAALVASGCILMRACHLNSCPVGIATQDPVLRKRFAGKPEHVVNMMHFIAEELRELMAEMGCRTVDELVGRADWLRPKAIDHPRGKTLDLAPLMHRVEGVSRCTEGRKELRLGAVAQSLVDAGRPAVEERAPIAFDSAIQNTDRSVGTRLSSHIAMVHGSAGLPDGSISARLHGYAGQSFGAFVAPGIELTLMGQANDYVGKGLAGGRIIVRAATEAPQLLIGNVALYGATAGELFVQGSAGERFAVRNSGAVAVVEGIGEHGCEYMTGGKVIVLGEVGRNFAAGMSGGTAYVYDPECTLESKVNTEMVDIEEISDETWQSIRSLVGRHAQLTGSRVAWELLASGSDLRESLRVIMPREYRRALLGPKPEDAVTVPEIGR